MTSEVLPRRRAVLGRLAGAAGGAVVVGAVGRAAPASAASTYAPASYTKVRVLPAGQRHLVNRFSYGLTPALAAQVRRAGSARKWFEAQLRPASVADGMPAGFDGWWPSLDRTAPDLWQRQVDQVEGGWEVMADYQRWVMMRRTYSNRQVLEVMTEFWENHLNVPVNGDAAFLFRASFGDVVRRHALGRFDQLLAAAITHPSMLVFLDNARSTKARPNENLARELLELHTVGRGHYDEDDVKASARILTGHWVDMWSTWSTAYRPDQHATGRVDVMGFGDDNPDPDGRAVTARYLTYLAHHEGTAQRIARKLAVKFVSDDPPRALVDRLARVYLDTRTAIVPVLQALVSSPEFAAAAGRKVRDPVEDVIASYRALGVRIGAPRSEESAVNQMLWQVGTLGTTPLAWPRPDGAPLDNASWSSPARVMASFEAHWAISGGWWPSKDVVYRKPAAWVPRYPISYRLLVDYLSRTILGRASTAQLLEACCLATGIKPGERITRDHHLVRWNMHRLLSTLLDSPAHMTR